ncbi:putative Ribonuclease VapC [Candidatus Sulfopaludibacter sp. SbA4]|nr:putative Ribonuclease VapC [Candidatus Sulfopaludibacter sp. SbA4]
MALYYLDTSALVKLYIRETGTERMLRLAHPEFNHRFAVLAISQVEFRSALRRRQRAGDIDQGTVAGLIQRFTQHLEATFLRQSLGEAILELACGLIDRHPLRAYDAVQLAGCLFLKANVPAEQPTFVCADLQLLEAAEAEGLAILNPESQA